MAKLPAPVTDMLLSATSILTRPLGAPVLNATLTGPTSATLTWTAPVPTGLSIIAGYRLKRAAVVSGPYTTLFDGLGLIFLDTFADQPWYYTVEAYDQYTTGTVSTPTLVTPSVSVPLFTDAAVTAGGETRAKSVVFEPPNGITVACWITAPSPTTTYQAFVSYGQDTTPFESYIIQAQTIDSTHPADFYFLTGAGTAHQLFGVTALQPGQLYSVVGTYDSASGAAALYVNGNLETSRTIAGGGQLFYPAAGGLGLGRKFALTTNNFSGTVTNVSIYGAALTAAQVAAQFSQQTATFAPPFPRIGLLGIGGASQLYPSSLWSLYGRFDLMLMNRDWEGADNGGTWDRETIVQGIKGASTAPQGTLVFTYHNANAVDPASTNYLLYANEVQARNWWLYAAAGSSGTKVPDPGFPSQFHVNYAGVDPSSTYAGKNPSGETPYQYAAAYMYNKLLIKTGKDSRFTSLAPGLASPSVDGIYTDNILLRPNVAGSWDRINVYPAVNEGGTSTASTIMLNGESQLHIKLRALQPSTKYMVGTLGGFGQAGITGVWGAMANIMHGGVRESLMGVGNVSLETFSTWNAARADYYQTMDFCLAPKLVALQASWPDGGAGGLPVNTLYQWGRYALCTTLLDNGFLMMNIASQGYSADSSASIVYLDEYGGNGGSTPNRGYLGQPLTARPTAAWTKGLWRRDFTNGIAIVNPKGNGTQTITTADLGGSGLFKALTGTQDAAVNNGATIVSSITLPERDGRIFLRVTGPVWSAPVHIVGTVGTPLSFNLDSVCTGLPTYTLGASLPAGLTQSGARGNIISGTPTQTVSAFSLPISADDGLGVNVPAWNTTGPVL